MSRSIAHRHVALGIAWVFALVINAEVCAGNDVGHQVVGQVSIENRWYPENGAYSDQSQHSAGLALEPEFYFESASGWSFNFVPFLRYDSADSRRSHVDLREAYFLFFGDAGDGEWELRLGVDRVFWGVVESNHLVDIVNQTDLVEHPNQEVELGQLMAHATWSGEWGALEVFALPHHRERTFPGQKGRLRPSAIVANDQVSYESEAEEWHADFAARYSQGLGLFDVGISLFDGTNREPVLQPGSNHNGNLVLIPYYEQITQFGLDAQLTTGSWLFKLETIHRADTQNLSLEEDDYIAHVIGGEYTFYSILNSAVDLGLLGEWNYDDRKTNANNIFQDDVFIGARVAFNDVQNTELFASILKDRNYSTSVLAIEFRRRISDQWSIDLELFSITDVDKEDIQLYPIRDDSFFEMRLHYNF